MENALLVQRIENNLVIVFNRPQLRSPLSISVLEALHRIVDECARDAGLEKLIFTGREKVFASGADLREIAAVTAETAREFALRGQTLMSKIAGVRALTMAAVNGFCFGGALDLALACRRRIAAPAAEFSHPSANLGIVTGWGGTQRLPRLVGEARALEIFLTGKRISAAEALAIGLVDEISDDPRAAALDSRFR